MQPPPQSRTGLWLLCAALAAALVGGAGYWITRPSSPVNGGLPPDGDMTPVDSGPPWFSDVTAGSGLDFTYRNGEEAGQTTMLEFLGGGVALLDYDGDGLLDIFVTGGGHFGGADRKQIKGYPCKLFRNLGGWKFKDVTKEVGLDTVSWWYTHGAAVADYDRDGWPDLLVTGYGRIALFRNVPVDPADPSKGRRFEDVTAKVGLKDDSWSTSAGWADLDGDGYPDLYVCHYLDWSWTNNPVCEGAGTGGKRDVCPPQKFKPLVHALFRNEKGERFREVTGEHGFKAEGCGLGVVLVDVNADGRPDIYVANDATNNFLFMNRGGKLEEKGMLAGVAVDNNGRFNASMGVDAADYDGSGRPSLWVTNFQFELHALYRNLGGESFDYASHAAGMAAIGMHRVGFGTAFVDVDNDGWEDLVIANGHVLRFPTQGNTLPQRPVLMRNVASEGRRSFQDISKRAGPFFQEPRVGRGVAVGDLDNDGRPDLVFSHTNGPVILLTNEAPAAKWLGVKLVGRDNRDVVGSTVVLQTDGRKLTRFAKGGGSYLSSPDRRILFGLGETGKPGRLTVRWAWGREESFDGLEPGAYWELREGNPQPRRLDTPPR